jgi:hypothetical protein
MDTGVSSEPLISSRLNTLPLQDFPTLNVTGGHNNMYDLSWHLWLNHKITNTRAEAICYNALANRLARQGIAKLNRKINEGG